MGATEKRAVDELVALGAEVRVALDARTTKLHAKAWLLERGSGLSTAFVGSSNLSHTALFDGLEWNVRLSSVDAGAVIDRVRMTFESHWASEHFEPYDPAVNGEELERGAARTRPPLARRGVDDLLRRSRRAAVPTPAADARRADDRARAARPPPQPRRRRDRHRQDRRRCARLQAARRPAGDLSLLFVAHREEILRQSLATYRAVLRDGSFGEIHGGGRIAEGRHVFAMIQSLQEDATGADRRRTRSTSSSSTSSITPRRRPTTGC